MQICLMIYVVSVLVTACFEMDFIARAEHFAPRDYFVSAFLVVMPVVNTVMFATALVLGLSEFLAVRGKRGSV